MTAIDLDPMRTTCRPSAPWSRVVRRGQTLRIIDSEGQQAVDALLYYADDPGRALQRAGHPARCSGSAYVGSAPSSSPTRAA